MLSIFLLKLFHRLYEDQNNQILFPKQPLQELYDVLIGQSGMHVLPCIQANVMAQEIK